MGKDYWDASVEQQLVANRDLILAESIIWQGCAVDVDVALSGTRQEEVQPPASEYAWTAMRVAHKDSAADRLRLVHVR
jgi:hypothetical protein